MRSDNSAASSTCLSARLAVWLATGLGIGLVAPAPGTIGGLWGLALAAPIAQLSPLGLQLAIVAVLFTLGISNVVIRAQWHEVEDGVFWDTRPEGVTAVDVAPGSAAANAGITTGDVLKYLYKQNKP